MLNIENIKNLVIGFSSANVVPILVSEKIKMEELSNSVLIYADDNFENLCPSFDEKGEVVPNWLHSLNNLACNYKRTYLVIKNLESISDEIQLKYREILEYRQICGYTIPDNTLIVIEVKDIENFSLHQELISNIAIIK